MPLKISLYLFLILPLVHQKHFLHPLPRYDERFCDPLMRLSVELPICVTFGMVACGALIFLLINHIEKRMQSKTDDRQKEETNQIELTAADENDMSVMCAIVDKIIESESVTETEYEELHRLKGGFKLLLGATFTFVDSSTALHKIATSIQQYEGDIQHIDSKYLREKAGSNKNTVKLITFTDKPNMIVRAMLAKERAINKVVQQSLKDSAEENNEKCGQHIKRIGIESALPLSKVFSRVLDFSKDISFSVFLFQRPGYLNLQKTCSTIELIKLKI